MMPPPGMSPQQTQQWSQGMQDSLRKGGQNPAMFGFAPPTTPSKPGPGRPSVMTAYGGQAAGAKPAAYPQATPSKPGPGRPSMSMYQSRPAGNVGRQAPAAPSWVAAAAAGGIAPQYIQPDGTRSHVPPAAGSSGPYVPSPSGGVSYKTGQAQPQQSPYGTSAPYGGGQGQKIRLADPVHPAQLGGNYIDPNVANNPYANRPPPFQATTQNFDGTQSQMPNFQQRDAFINQITNQLGQMQGQSWQRPGMGAPQFNFPQMWGQAGQMADQGWRSPFASALLAQR